MKIRAFFVFGFLFSSPLINAQEQFYSTVDITANILELTYDTKLIPALNSGTILVADVRGSKPELSQPWRGITDLIWLKMNKTVSCAGKDVENFIVLPIKIEAIDPVHAHRSPNTPWVAGPSPDYHHNGMNNLFFSAFTNNLEVRFTKVICGNPQLHPVNNQLVSVAYIQDHKSFKITPPQHNNTVNSAWINGVQVTPTNYQPTNAVVTNWNFTIPTAGNYDVYVHWVSNKNQVANISYSVNGQPLKSAALDQNINAGIWVKLIKNTQYSVGEQSIKISVDANANYVVDGVRAEKTAQ